MPHRVEKEYLRCLNSINKLIKLKTIKINIEEKCSDNFASLDFLYSRLPCSVFEDYLAKRLKIQPFEFFSVKYPKKRKIEPTPEETKKTSTKKVAAKKKENVIAPPKGNMSITSFFKPKEKT